MMTSDDLHKLKAMALPVMSDGWQRVHSSPRGAACALSGMAKYVATVWGPPTMWEACAHLTSGDLMTTPDNMPASILMASVTGLLLVFRVDHVRAALAFWASERDPAVWQAVMGDGDSWPDVMVRDSGSARRSVETLAR